jgi:hypothetical protein
MFAFEEKVQGIEWHCINNSTVIYLILVFVQIVISKSFFLKERQEICRKFY